LITEKPLLALFGFRSDSEIIPDGIVYNAYLQLGILGPKVAVLIDGSEIIRHSKRILSKLLEMASLLVHN